MTLTYKRTVLIAIVQALLDTPSEYETKLAIYLEKVKAAINGTIGNTLPPVPTCQVNTNGSIYYLPYLRDIEVNLRKQRLANLALLQNAIGEDVVLANSEYQMLTI